MKSVDNSHYATLQALYVQKKGMEIRHRRQEEEKKFDILDKPSFQVIWLCNVLSNH